ncbi:hypothetical protein AB0876_33410 [Mycobacterium sp. NPDC049093]
MNSDGNQESESSITLVQGLLDALSQFDLTPDDRATLELIRADIETTRQATANQASGTEAMTATAFVSRELLFELRTIAEKYA